MANVLGDDAVLHRYLDGIMARPAFIAGHTT
jgi:hypothetical protein